ncbi:MAG: cupin domain-containing protein, partial [Rhizobiales bacterium]|nr:cupin domain-containing protein [Hyphomicrobiales bacterium]
GTGAKRTRIRDLAGLFLDDAAFAALAEAQGDDVAYGVDEFRPARSAPQELTFGTSTLQPGRVGDEFFMTRGHIHVKSDRPEIYYCQEGRGVMHMELPSGETRPVEMAPGTVVYVPPYWIHRSVNTGRTPLVTFFCYPADAGQDYDIIARAGGMKTLIVADGDGWREAENPRHRPRAAAEVARYTGPAA